MIVLQVAVLILYVLVSAACGRENVQQDSPVSASAERPPKPQPPVSRSSDNSNGGAKPTSSSTEVERREPVRYKGLTLQVLSSSTFNLHFASMPAHQAADVAAKLLGIDVELAPSTRTKYGCAPITIHKDNLKSGRAVVEAFESGFRESGFDLAVHGSSLQLVPTATAKPCVP